MEPTLRRVLRSDREDVVRLGASHTVALYFLTGRMEAPELDCLRGDLVPFAECILEVCRSLAERRKEGGEHRPGMSWEAGYYLPPVLLRLYEQAPNGSAVRASCLDAWDLLLDARVLTAMTLTKSLDAA